MDQPSLFTHTAHTGTVYRCLAVVLLLSLLFSQRDDDEDDLPPIN